MRSKVMERLETVLFSDGDEARERFICRTDKIHCGKE
jgi:hypothetical protein